MRDKIIIISGPTASGKSGLALTLAKKINGVIINADSMQIYKGLPILSAQPTKREQENIPHLLYSYLEPTKNCSVGLWLDLAQKAINETLSQKQTPIIVGGTGMYISKLIDGIIELPKIPEQLRQETNNLFNRIGYEEFYRKIKEIDPIAVLKLAPNDKQRLTRIFEIHKLTGKKLSDLQKQPNQKLYPQEQFFHINLNPPRESLYKKCNQRFEIMFNNGGLDEIQQFMRDYPQIIQNPRFYSVSKTLGLQEIVKYINGEINREIMFTEAMQKTRNYAKRQYTWFKNQFKNIKMIFAETISEENLDEITQKILNKLK
jgi:tRNA dimethylallyltransferase